MFIEVYIIPAEKWTEPAINSKIHENRKLISLASIKDIDYSIHCSGRAEIEYNCGQKVTVVGSYDEIVERIADTFLHGKIIRSN